MKSSSKFSVLYTDDLKLKYEWVITKLINLNEVFLDKKIVIKINTLLKLIFLFLFYGLIY